MRTRIYGVTAILALAASTVGASTVAPGNLIASQTGDGTTTLGASAAQISLWEFPTTVGGSAVQSVILPSTAAARFTIAGTGDSEGQLTLNGGYLGIAGYDADVGTANVTTSTTPTVLRKLDGFNLKVDLAAGPQITATTTQFSGNNVRSALVKDGNSFYALGGSSGLIYLADGSVASPGVVVSSSAIINGNPASNVNSRSLEAFNGNLYLFSPASARGIYTVPGMPTTAGVVATSTVLTPAAGNGGVAVSGYQFWISPDLSLAYLAEDTSGSGGIKKYVRGTDGTYTLAYTISTDYDGAGSAPTGARGLAVDTSGTFPLLYATNKNGKAILAITDTGTAAGALSTLQVLQTAGTNMTFHGLVLYPHLPGDTDDSGTLTGDDYVLIDKGFARYTTGAISAGTAVWRDGDYNHDGSVDAADYLVIDRAYGTATGQLDPDLLDQRLTQFGQGYVDSLIASVPEPTTALLTIPAAALLRRRRRV